MTYVLRVCIYRYLTFLERKMIVLKVIFNANPDIYDEDINDYLDESDQVLDDEDDIDINDEVMPGSKFYINGVEYQYVELIESVYLDFDNWGLYSCINLDENEELEDVEDYDENKLEYLVVELDINLIDWEPTSYDDAKEFYDGKIEDYNQDEFYDDEGEDYE